MGGIWSTSGSSLSASGSVDGDKISGARIRRQASRVDGGATAEDQRPQNESDPSGSSPETEGTGSSSSSSAAAAAAAGDGQVGNSEDDINDGDNAGDKDAAAAGDDDDDDRPAAVPELEDDELPEAGLSYRAPARNKFAYVDHGLGASQEDRRSAGDEIPLLRNREFAAEPIHEPPASGNRPENETMTAEPEPPAETSTPEEPVTPETILLIERVNPDAEPESKLGIADPEGGVPEPEEFDDWQNVTSAPEDDDDDDTSGGSDAVLGDESFAEPHPDWTDAMAVYGASFHFHVYLFGALFAVLAIYTVVCMVLLRRKRNLLSRGYFMSLNAMLLVIGLTRAVYLLVDGYDTRRRFPRLVSYVLINVTFPCITSAFSVLFMALLKATKMQLMTRRIQKITILLVVIGAHFLFSLIVDVIVSVAYTARALFIVCQAAFVIWGMFLFCGYLYLFWKLYRTSSSCEPIDRRVYDPEFPKRSSRGVAPSESAGVAGVSTKRSPDKSKWCKSLRPKVMLNLALRVTLATAILGITNVAIVIYGMVGVFNFLSHDTPRPWPFYSYHFCMRLVEFGMCATMSFVATQPLRYRSRGEMRGQQHATDCLRNSLYFCPCYRLTADDSDIDGSSDVTSDKYLDSAAHFDMPPGAERCWEPTSDCHQMTPMMMTTTTTTTMTNKSQDGGGDVTATKSRSGKPMSMLYYHNGLVRFRQDGDSEGDPIASTDDELDSEIGPPRYDGRQAGRENGHLPKYGESGPDQLERIPNGTTARNNAPWAGGWCTPSGLRTPATPRSLCSTDIELNSGTFSFRPPSSIHLRDSIERELNYADFHLQTPDNFLEPVDSVRDTASLARSPDALRASVYSYATSASGCSPYRKLYSAQSSVSSTSSLSGQDIVDLSASNWFQKYLLERFGPEQFRPAADSAEAPFDDTNAYYYDADVDDKGTASEIRLPRQAAGAGRRGQNTRTRDAENRPT